MTEVWQVAIYAAICGVSGGIAGAMILLWFENRFCRRRDR